MLINKLITVVLKSFFVMSPKLLQSLRKSITSSWEKMRRKKKTKEDSRENIEDGLTQEDRTIIDLKKQQARLLRLIKKVRLNKKL